MHRTHIFITCGALAVVILSIVLIAIGVSTGKVDNIPSESGTTPDVTVSTITVDDPVNSGTGHMHLPGDIIDIVDPWKFSVDQSQHLP